MNRKFKEEYIAEANSHIQQITEYRENLCLYNAIHSNANNKGFTDSFDLATDLPTTDEEINFITDTLQNNSNICYIAHTDYAQVIESIKKLKLDKQLFISDHEEKKIAFTVDAYFSFKKSSFINFMIREGACVMDVSPLTEFRTAREYAELILELNISFYFDMYQQLFNETLKGIESLFAMLYKDYLPADEYINYTTSNATGMDVMKHIVYLISNYPMFLARLKELQKLQHDYALEIRLKACSDETYRSNTNFSVDLLLDN